MSGRWPASRSAPARITRHASQRAANGARRVRLEAHRARVRPDAETVLTAAGRELRCLLEYGRGTLSEGQHRVKLAAYRGYAAQRRIRGRPPPTVLVVGADAESEQRLMRLAAEERVPLTFLGTNEGQYATAPGGLPGAVWRASRGRELWPPTPPDRRQRVARPPTAPTEPAVVPLR